MIGDDNKSLGMLPLMAVLDLQLDLVDEISRKVGDEYPVTDWRLFVVFGVFS